MSKRILFVLIALSIGLFLTESSLWAQTQNRGASFLVKMGNQFLSEGDFQGAISEFSKALMLEPDNGEALKQLSLLGFDRGIYDGAQTQGSRIAKLASDRVMYRNQADQFEKEKNSLQIKLNKLQAEHQSLLGENLSKNEELSKAEEIIKDHERTFQRLSSVQQERIDELSNTITQLQRKDADPLIRQSLDFWEQNKKMVDLDSYVRDSVVRSLESEKELMDLQSRYDGLKQKVDLSDFDKNNVFGVLQDYLYVRTHELGVLKDQMVMSEIDLLQNQNNLMDKINEIQNLQESLKGFEDQVFLQELVIQEKNTDLKYLRDTLGIRSPTVENETQTDTQKIRRLEGKLQSSVEQMQGMLKERKTILDGIKEKVEKMREIEKKDSQKS